MPQAISANRLTDGIIVYLGRGENWVERLADAHVFADKAAIDAGLAAAQAAVLKNLVVEVTPFDVEVRSKGPVALHIRDRIRAAGPSVHLDHGKQAG